MTPPLDAQAMGSSFATQHAMTSAVTEMLVTVPGLDNPLFRAMIQVFVVSTIPKLVTVAFTPFEKLATLFMWLLGRVWAGLNYAYYWIRREPVQYKFSITVAQMNADRQPSALYDAVLWYIMSRPKEEREMAQELEFFVPKQNATVAAALESNMRGGAAAQQAPSTLEELKRKLLSTIPSTQSSRFLWKESGVYISFRFETEQIEIPGDKNRKKENRKIILWRTTSTQDLYDWFTPVLAEILQDYEESKKTLVWKQETWVNRKDGQWEKLRNSNTRSLETTILKAVQKERIENILAKFTDTEEIEFMKKVGRPNKLTFLLHGPPGCGKTTLQQAVSSQLKRHLYYLNLSNVSSNEQLTQLFEKIDNANSVVVLEEIDVATIEVLNRELRDEARAELKAKANDNSSTPTPAAQNPGAPITQFTLEGLLNVLQGNVDADKRILFMTTNRPQVLDPALVRPGRVDCDLELGACDIYQIECLFKLYYEDRLEEQHLVTIRANFEKAAKDNADFKAPTPCQVDNLLVQFRDDIDRGIEAYQQLLKNPSQEIFVPAKQRKVIDS